MTKAIKRSALPLAIMKQIRLFQSLEKETILYLRKYTISAYGIVALD